GIDIDPEALRWAERNVRLNRIGDVLHLASTPVETISGPFSVVCANLMLEEIRRLLDRLLELAAPGGWLILSGLLIEQEEAVTPLFGTRGIERQEVLHEAEWVCLMLRKARAV
ncbi:MAG: 50S ribosomal protein L11 methyltransferase, partial [Thermodesulfobacteriota bacterium]